MNEEIHPLQEIIKQQAAEIARMNDALSDALGDLNDLADLKNAEIARLHTEMELCIAEIQRKDALLRDALEALELSRDNVNECLNEALAHKGYIRWDKRASAYAVQLAQHDKVTEAIKEELKC